MPRYYRDKIYTTKEKEKINKQRSADLSVKAKKITDVFDVEHRYGEYKKEAYRKMYMKEQKKWL